jgi:hypothetical protein
MKRLEWCILQRIDLMTSSCYNNIIRYTLHLPHLLINDATKDSHASTPENAINEPAMYW